MRALAAEANSFPNFFCWETMADDATRPKCTFEKRCKRGKCPKKKAHLVEMCLDYLIRI